MKLEINDYGSNEFVHSEGVTVFNDDHNRMSSAGFTTLQSRYCGKYITTLTVGGIGTDPRYRRMGCVRAIFDLVLPLAPERGWSVAMLHPFSAAYYRKFGFEKIADHLILEFPITKLDFVPRDPSLKLLDSDERTADAIAIYEEFASKRSIMFRRYDGSKFNQSRDGKGVSTYIWYDEAGKPASYVTLWVENYYDINKMTSINLNVTEMAFTTPDSLRALFGFMRMYEGENDTVKIHNCAMSPEVDAMLRYYTHTSYRRVSDIQARILDVKTMLEANVYPEEAGHFRVYVDDTLDFTRGLWEVEYGGGKGEAKKLNGGDYDLYAPMPAFTQLVYGYDEYTADIAAYMEGVKLNSDCRDFFRAFHKKPAGLFEHF